MSAMVSSLHCLRNKTGLTIDVYALCALYLRCLTETAWQLEPCLGALHDVLRNHGDLPLDRGKARRLAPWQNSKQQGLDSSHNRTKENNETTKIPALSKFRGHLQEKAFKGSLLSARNIPKRNHFDVNEKQRQVRKYLNINTHNLNCTEILEVRETAVLKCHHDASLSSYLNFPYTFIIFEIWWEIPKVTMTNETTRVIHLLYCSKASYLMSKTFLQLTPNLKSDSPSLLFHLWRESYFWIFTPQRNHTFSLLVPGAVSILFFWSDIFKISFAAGTV